MPQYNMHNELNVFYQDHVRLKDEIERLRELRNTNLTRLTDGLNEMGHATFVKNLLQGSIAMHTANKSTNNDYDIDIAVIFEESDLPATPLEARKRVAEAISRKASGFSKDPEARTNAVTVWYAAGYHVDIAIYRRREDWLGNEILEHAGASWTKRDPKEVTRWFTREVERQSPSKNIFSTPLVSSGQMRRIVRWIKAFTKGREGWNLPGGFIISALVAECYQADNDRDDIALHKTLTQIKSRLDGDCDVYNPADSSQLLTQKSKFSTQVKNLKKRLGSVLSKLDVLFDDSCTDQKARKAWNYMFQHSYWEQVESARASNKQGYNLQLTVDVSQSEGGFVLSKNVLSGRFLPKRVHLKFEARTNVPSPYTIQWRVVNSGDEAEAANDMGHVAASQSLTHWERTAYRGQHEMICEILKSGEVQASTKHLVNIR
ncbi:MAG: cyclic GMP-AMP synthase DncV-like nucleotidyltransferase [Saccharospirillum sp.]|uniref:nucleotide-binding domain-containing protein n=1 Tax=Saccharospirillum sp. TaxID=2033801 RepID=UPI003298D6F5